MRFFILEIAGTKWHSPLATHVCIFIDEEKYDIIIKNNKLI